jgi:hypothetical protein
VLLREDGLEGALPEALEKRPFVVAPTIVGAAAPPAAVSLAADGRPRVHNLWRKTADLQKKKIPADDGRRRYVYISHYVKFGRLGMSRLRPSCSHLR